MKPMVEQTESNTQEAVKETAADSGCGSYANYEYLEQKGIDGYSRDHFQQYKSGEYKKEEKKKTGITIPILNMMEQPIVMCVPKGSSYRIGRPEQIRPRAVNGTIKFTKGTECEGHVRNGHYVQRQR